ncbi:MAG: hypothetical protein ACFFBD_26180, partial [Candidatus Hodarchaeota archaeon]
MKSKGLVIAFVLFVFLMVGVANTVTMGVPVEITPTPRGTNSDERAEAWGITSSSFSSTSTHSNVRYMGGTSPNVDVTVTKLHIRCGSSGTVSIALYTGGSLSNPTGAVRRTEAHGVSVSSGWNEIDVPDYGVAANSITWIGWAHSCSVYYSTSSSNAGDFQSGRGRWSQSSPSNYNENSALPTNPGSGSFSNYWYAVYAEYEGEAPPPPPPPEGTWGITSSSFSSSSTHSNVRYMGGTSPNGYMTVTKLHIRCGSSGTVSIALYTGGSLSNPTGAV